MKTIGLLIQREMLKATLWSLGGFAALLTFFDLLDELKSIGQPSLTRPGQSYQLTEVAAYLALGLPSHAYTLLPICLLIGGVFVMARLAQQSEFTVLRMGGLGPSLALRTVLVTGALLAVTTFVLGDYVVPLVERQQALLKANYRGNISTGRSGAWMRERTEDGSIALNLGALNAQGQPQDVRIFEFDLQGRLRRDISAASATIDDGHAWTLIHADVRHYPQEGQAPPMTRESTSQLHWPTALTTGMISAELLKNNRMSTLNLYQYIRHLRANDQNAQRFEIEFWRKLFYPLSCLVMVVMVLPFAYLHFRRGGIAGYVFLGVMAGISFYLLNNLFGFIGNLNGWIPWLAAASPSLMYSAISLTAFAWLVAKR